MRGTKGHGVTARWPSSFLHLFMALQPMLTLIDRGRLTTYLYRRKIWLVAATSLIVVALILSSRISRSPAIKLSRDSPPASWKAQGISKRDDELLLPGFAWEEPTERVPPTRIPKSTFEMNGHHMRRCLVCRYLLLLQ